MATETRGATYGGRRVVIGHLDEALAALRGEVGTQMVPDNA
jgi:hypothetical protein